MRRTRTFAFLLSAFTLAILPTFANAAINHEGTFTADSGGLSASSVVVNNVTAGTDQLYLVAVVYYMNGPSVSSISGGGLTWSHQKTQCSARLNQPHTEIWQAYGSPGSTFNATVTMTGTVDVLSAAVSRYSGADSTTPTEGAVGSNTNGQNGACDNTGVDNTAASLSVTSSQNDSVIYVVTHPRNNSISTPDGDYTERAVITNSNGGDGANMHVHDRTLATAGADSIDHTLGSAKDWEMTGLVINPASAGSCPIDVSIAASSDDAEEDLSDGSISLGSSDLELVNDGTDQEIGLRFLNLDIPQGATIDSAYITFYAKNTSSGGTLNLTLYAEDIDDAPTFVNATNDITNRTKTTASVAWNGITDWNTADQAHQSPELKTIIQEVVDRGGWAANNDLAIIVSGTAGVTRRAWSFDGTGTAPALHVECSAGGGSNNAVTSAVAEISPNDVITSATGNSFNYDIQATIGGSDTGVDRVAITVPGAFGAPTVTDVLVDGSSVAYTDNTSGNDISVDLTTKVTASSRITVQFDANSPTSADATGVDFTSTVDDSGTGDAAQSTTEGNGDGDSGDNDTWTVTTTDGGTNVLLVVGDAGSPSSQDSAKKTLIETWGYTVTYIDDGDTQANYDSAIASNDVIYVSEESSSTNIGDKITGACIGIVNEEGDFYDELGIATGDAEFSASAIDVTDTSHYITSYFGNGSTTIATASLDMKRTSGTVAGGAVTLAEQLSSSNRALVVIEAGGALTSPPGGNAAGRRVKVPWGHDTLDINLLNDDGKIMMRRALEWGTSGDDCTVAVSSAIAEISPNDVTSGSTSNAFDYDIQATISGTTGVNRVEITVPGSFGAPTVTDVLVDDSSVAYTDNTSGNNIRVDLTSKVTSSSKITVQFNADAPSTEDPVGVNFTSTVDDSGTGDAAQATTEGNGDGDAGDNNSWSVTTTDTALGSCVAYDGAASTGSNSATNSVTVSHTTSGTDRLMLVGVSVNNDGNETVSSVTYNGINLTQVGTVTESDDAIAEIWRLTENDGLPTGTYDVVVTYSAILQRESVVGVQTFTNVDQTTPLGTFASDIGDNSGPAQITVSSATDEMVFGVISVEDEVSPITTPAPADERWNLEQGIQIGSAATKGGASSVTMTWLFNGSDHWAAGGVSIKPASCGGGDGNSVVNSTGDASDNNAGDGVCDTGGTNSASAAECTLRAAIEEANAYAGANTITFNMPTTEPGYTASPLSYTITPATALPTISEQVTIDGSSQPDFPGTPIVLLDGNDVAANGLTLGGAADSSTIRGLIIRDFGDNGIELLAGSDSHTIAGNYIGGITASGTDAGSTERNTNRGIEIYGSSSTIGGTVAADRNVISNNDAEGIIIRSGANNNIIRGNYIGVASNGTTALGNQQEGIQILAGAAGTIIGGTASGAENVIGANGIASGAAISVEGDGTDNTVIQGNYIGTDTGGTVDLGNIRSGVEVRGDSVAANSPLNTLIGGDGANEGNVIRFNDLDGIRIRNIAVDVTILGNSIDNNSQQGIDLWPDASNDDVTENDAGDGDAGSNDLLNFPVITAAAETSGTIDVDFDLDVAAGDYRIEFFKNPSGADASGNGEGETFASAVTISHTGSGSESFSHSFSGSQGDIITATATEQSAGPVYGSTSEFSDAFTATLGGSLIGHWEFNEGTGQTAGDSSATSNDGTLGPTSGSESEDPSWVCVAGGNALDFDGTDDEVRLGSVAIGDSAEWSITAWIKMGADSADKRTIYGEGNTTDRQYLFFYVDEPGTHVEFYSEGSGGSNPVSMSGSTNVETDTWHLVTVVQRSKTDREMYVGTNSEATSTANAGTLSFDTASIGQLRTEGNPGPGIVASDRFKGWIDDVRIYDYALSTSEISTLNASPPGAPCGAVTSAVAEISPNDVETSSTGNSFTYDIQPTIGASDTGVNRVSITVPGTFGAPTVTAVQVSGSGVGYTDNTAGNNIVVDLDTKVTSSSRITVLFNADAPTSADATGVDFTSTVDDTTTAVAAQSTTEGNGDGDSGDNDSWTVTTSDPISANLLGHWELDEGSGQTAGDSSSSNNDGTLGNSAGSDSFDPDWACVAGGYALDFDGTDKKVEVGSVTINDRAAWTLSAWIKMDADTADQRTIYAEGSSSVEEYLFLYVDDSTNHAKFWIKDSSSSMSAMESTTNVEDGQWHHITLVQRAKNDRELFVDGVSEDTDTFNIGTLSFDMARIGFLEIGAWDADPFKGLIDDVRIYDDALTASEVASLAANPPTDCGGNVLIIADDSASPGASDTALQAYLEGRGLTIFYADDDDAEYDTAIANNNIDVVYISSSAFSSKISPAKVGSLTVGVVNANNDNNDDLCLGGGDTNTDPETTINLVDNSHFVTSPYSTGNFTAYTSGARAIWGGSYGAGAQVLAQNPSNAAEGAIVVFETDAMLDDCPTVPIAAPARRVGTYADADFSVWTATTKDIIYRSLIWGSGGNPAGNDAVTSAVAEISPNDVTTSSTGNSFTYDIQATISGSATGVNRVAITVPAGFSNVSVTGVQVDGSGVAYTDNTAGNAISVDLTTKVTASSKITVLFDADAPTSQDLTGVDFTSTVDDSSTGKPAQATSEGNGDGDSGDNNSWTVTTTNAPVAVTNAVAEIAPNDVETNSTGNSFSYDIQATIGGSDTGVNRVAITVPGTFGAPTVTGVQVDGSGVAYTDNTSGNNISVDLTTKVTVTSRITVLFDADAPTSQDLTGVAFTSTVDDSGTGEAAQASSQGNGDGDGGDNNSWVVTTTDIAGLVAHWEFDEGSGQTAADATGNGHTATLGTSAGADSADPAWVCVGSGYALSFDGNDDIINAGSGAALDDLEPFTIMAWVKPDSSDVGGVSQIIARGTGNGRWFIERDNTSPEVHAYEFNKQYDSSDLMRVTSNNTVTYDAWQHIAVTWDGSDFASNVHIYKNGVETGYQTTNNGSTTKQSDAAIDLVMGNREDGTQGLTGLLENVRIYDRVLTAGEIATLASNTPTDCANNAATSAVAEISPNDVVTSSTGNSFEYDILATITGSNTGVDRIAITVPGAFGAPTVTDVKVDNVSVAYTDNTVGNAISVDLTTKLTATSRITVLFDSDAPITQDQTGVNFLSTVDDSGTGDAPQNTTEGNGDSDAGDNNSWTVTTTDAGGGACLAVDGSASTNTATTGTSMTISHTTSGSDRLMLVGVSIDNNSNETVSSVTYNSIALSLVGTATQSNDAHIEIWQLTESGGLPTGTHDVVITFSGSLTRPAVGGVMTFTGVDQSTPLGTFAGANGTSTAPSVNVSSVVGELVFAVLSAEDTSSVTTDAPATERWNVSIAGGGNTEWGAGATDDGAASVDMSWTLGTSDYWAVGGVSIKPSGSCNAAVTSAVAEISPNDVATSSTSNAFSYDIYATISGGDTGVNVVSITVPGSFGAPTVSDVLVNSVSVPYTDNTSGNAISVVLNSKVTVSNRITVLFNADAPTTQDLAGVDFVSTVDDNGTSDSPQATTEGNGDNDAGDNNSWTVTTTDGGGGGADPVVNSTGDAGDNNAGNGVCDTGGLNSQSNTECTLRAAIQEANASVGLDTITFNMPTSEPGYSGSPLSYTINPGSVLPTITDLVIIDGTTQPGASGTPIVVLDGNNLGAVGLTLGDGADGSTIRGFVIRDFGDNGLEIQAGSDGNTIAGNYIGRLNVSGTDAGAGEENAVRGIEILSDNNTIGGVSASDRNVISGNGGEGIIIRSGASNNIVRGNYIGTEADGATGLGNDDEAIQIDTGSPGTIIGGTASGAENVIGFNGTSSGAAISIGGDGSDNTVVQGNYIGTDPTGTLDLGNIRSGVEVRGTDNAATSPLNTLIGGTGSDEGNIIRFNDLDGVRIRNVAVDVAILGNQIDNNGQQGIDLWAASSNDDVTANDSGDGDSGANYLMNYPVITSAIANGGNIDVQFDLDVTAGNYRVEFFKNPSGADPSGNGEGETYVSSVNIAHGGTGSESFAHSFSGVVGDILSATATEELSGPTFVNTSEFSATYTVTAGTAVASAVAEISPNDVATAGGVYLFEYDIAAVIGAANTGVDRVAITVPAAFGVSGSPVINVLVDGVTVAFTDNTVGNAISVDLTTKVTTNARITVVFEASAPVTQDLVGVDFTSTVDDSVTGDAPQDTTEGEGDGDTEDNNSWTVTTTGAGGGGGGTCTALDGSPTSLVQAGGGSLTISHTTSGSERLMVVGVSIALGSGETVSSVTYNGDALTFQGSAQGPGNDSRVEIWTRVAPDVGTHDVVVNLSASSHDGASAGVATFTGVDQTTPLGTFASDSGTGGSASFNVSSAAGDIVFGVVAVDDSTDYNLVPGSGQAEHWDLDTDELNASGTTEDGAASVTTSWTWSGSDDFAAGGISIKAASGGCDTAASSAVAEISPNDVITGSTGNAFAYDITTTVNAGDTGVDRVAITVPGTFGAPTVSDVLVDGVPVSYTDNTSGNDISVDLTTKVTYSARITVLFTSDAPGTQDLTGKDFLSTVDDSGDPTAPQSTTEGNGDGDSGDNDDWTVTTTDSGGASCEIDPAGTYIEAENYTALVAGTDSGTFTVESSQSGYNGTGYLLSNNGDTGGSPPDDMRADYTVEFTTTGTYYIWIRGYATGSGDNSIWIGLDGTDTGVLQENGTYNQWIWTDDAQSGVNTINIPTAGWYTINLWVRESGHLVDGIYITQDSGAIPGGTSIDIPTPGGSGGTFTKRVNASTDDAEQRVASPFDMDLSSSDLELHDSGGDGYVGMRWTGVTIPQGATIDDARIQFHVDEIATPESSEALTVTFVGEDVDNASTFTSTASDISDRFANETTASVDWAIPTWVAIDDEGAAQLSADLSPIVQEIVDRGTWSSGNAMVIMIKAWSGTGERTAESENGEATAAPELQIDYTTGGSQATIIDPSNCGAGAGIHHFAIIHDGTGINCQAEDVTIEAHTSGHSVETTFGGTLVLSTSTLHGDWSLVSGSGSLTSGGKGNAVYGFSSSDNGSVTLGLRDTFVETVNIDVNSQGVTEDGSEDDDLVFARSGFNFLADSAKNTIGLQIGGKPSNVAPGAQTLELQAIKTNDDTGQCEAALQGSTTIDIGFECEDPTTCATNTMTFGGVSIPANANNAVPTYARVNMDFGNAADDTATFTMQYNDVGKIRLYARNRLLPSGEEMIGASNSFVVRPFAFDLSATGNPAATGPTDPVFTQAGAEFTANVTALLWEAADDTDNDGVADNHDDTDPSNNADLTDNAAAPNYGYETAVEQVLLTAALDQPAGGSNPGLSGGTSVTVFTNGTGTTTTVRYDEVGIIEMAAQVADNDYLGIGATETGKITSKSGYVGRFNPARYDVTAGDINPACSATFTYSRQPFTGSMTIEAQNAAAAGNNRTENYRGAFVTLDPNTELVFINSATSTAYDAKTVTYNQGFDSGNFGEAVLALQFRWDMGEQAPTTSTVQNTGVTDEVNTLASAPVSIGSSPTRFGRAIVGTAAGSELVDLEVVMRTEYYLDSTNGYVVNSDDFCSTNAVLSLSNFADNLNLGETCVQDTGNPGLSGAGCTVAGPILKRYNDPLIAGD
ncbi:MAG: DUF6701 domain-containing protein, partial [Woeseiaceae bacterium]|nr:DUF6701 domain-containing protein [Woeseiaceae bacterium]